MDSCGAQRASVSHCDPLPALHQPFTSSPSKLWSLVRALAAVCVWSGTSTSALAELNTTALARFSSNYLYHGYTKSDDHPVVQAHAGVTHTSGVYGGAWLAQLDFGGAQLELIPYVGVQHTVAGDFRFDAVLSGYVYDADVFGTNANYVETSASVDWRGLLGARFSVAFDSYGAGHTTKAAELKGRYPLTDVLDFTAGAGFDDLAMVTTYDVVYWNAGFSYFIGAHAVIDLRYVDNVYINEVHGPGVVDRFVTAEVASRAVLSISVGF